MELTPVKGVTLRGAEQDAYRKVGKAIVERREDMKVVPSHESYDNPMFVKVDNIGFTWTSKGEVLSLYIKRCGHDAP